MGALRFSDEFNDNTIDLAKWSPTWLAGNTGYSPPINGNEDGCYHSDQASEHGGSLHLQTAASGGSSSCRTRSGSQASIKSGIVTSAGKFEARYGYFEARIHMDGAYNWPAWWTNGHHNSWPDRGELDIMELLSCRRPSYRIHYGSGSDVNLGSCSSGSIVGWHTYAMRWTPSRIDFFYDGINVFGANISIPHDHYMILNHAVRSDYTNGMTIGADMQVDYVRVWGL